MRAMIRCQLSVQVPKIASCVTDTTNFRFPDLIDYA